MKGTRGRVPIGVERQLSLRAEQGFVRGADDTRLRVEHANAATDRTRRVDLPQEMPTGICSAERDLGCAGDEVEHDIGLVHSLLVAPCPRHRIRLRSRDRLGDTRCARVLKRLDLEGGEGNDRDQEDQEEARAHAAP